MFSMGFKQTLFKFKQKAFKKNRNRNKKIRNSKNRNRKNRNRMLSKKNIKENINFIRRYLHKNENSDNSIAKMAVKFIDMIYNYERIKKHNRLIKNMLGFKDNKLLFNITNKNEDNNKI